MPQRLRGQETFISILIDGELRTRINSITSAEFTVNTEVQTDNFLGDTAPEFDSIYNGVSFRIEGQLANSEYLDFQQQVIAKAGRRAGAAVRIDIATTLVFPNGEVRTVGYDDVAIGPMPLSTGGREEFTTWTIEGSAREGRPID